MNYLVKFLAGALLCNSIPHLACGLRGEPFPTPFAKPRGVGDSPAPVNFLCGFLNLVVGMTLVSNRPVAVEFSASFVALIIGAMAMSTYLSLHFGKVRRGKERDDRKNAITT
jgi:hypothetical protein